MTTNPTPPAGPETPLAPAPPARLFLRESGWRIAQKVGSEREFCYMLTPGQDYYHRLLDGEIYVYHGDERLCLACAERRGLLSHEPKGLREKVITLDVAEVLPTSPSDYELGQTDAQGASD